MLSKSKSSVNNKPGMNIIIQAVGTSHTSAPAFRAPSASSIATTTPMIGTPECVPLLVVNCMDLEISDMKIFKSPPKVRCLVVVQFDRLSKELKQSYKKIYETTKPQQLVLVDSFEFPIGSVTTELALIASNDVYNGVFCVPDHVSKVDVVSPCDLNIVPDNHHAIKKRKAAKFKATLELHQWPSYKTQPSKTHQFIPCYKLGEDHKEIRGDLVVIYGSVRDGLGVDMQAQHNRIVSANTVVFHEVSQTSLVLQMYAVRHLVFVPKQGNDEAAYRVFMLQMIKNASDGAPTGNEHMKVTVILMHNQKWDVVATMKECSSVSITVIHVSLASTHQTQMLKLMQERAFNVGKRLDSQLMYAEPDDVQPYHKTEESRNLFANTIAHAPDVGIRSLVIWRTRTTAGCWFVWDGVDVTVEDARFANPRIMNRMAKRLSGLFNEQWQAGMVPIAEDNDNSTQLNSTQLSSTIESLTVASSLGPSVSVCRLQMDDAHFMTDLY